MDDPQRRLDGATDTGGGLDAAIVREVLARLARGECVKAIARELGVDKKTIIGVRGASGGRGRLRGPRRSTPIGCFWRAGGPRSVGSSGRRASRAATAGAAAGADDAPGGGARDRGFDTAPGDRRSDFGQLRVWIADVSDPGPFLRLHTRLLPAGRGAYRNIDTLLDGHEPCTLAGCSCVRQRTTLGRSAGQLCPRFEDSRLRLHAARLPRA